MSYSGPAARLVRRDTNAEIALDRPPITIGREPTNAVVVPDQRVSRHHARIAREGDTYWIEDLGGSNGTLVNGQRIAGRVALQHADNITIGDAQFSFLAPPLRPAPQPAPGTFAPPPLAGSSLAPPAPQPNPFAPPASPFTPPPGPALAPPGFAPPGFAPPPVPTPAPGWGPGTPAPVMPTTRAVLQVIAGPATGMVYEVRAGGGVLGRGPENVVAIQDGQLSRQHAQIGYSNGAFWLTDLNSRNGTFVNGTRVIAPHQLRPGDQITLGGTRLVVGLDAG